MALRLIFSQQTLLSASPPAIRADRIMIRGVRLPYLKFPRNPER